MADNYGWTADGFIPKTTANVFDDIVRGLRGIFPNTTFSSKTYIGAQSAIVADIAGALWDELQATISMADPNQAEEAALRVLASIQLVFAAPPQPSSVTLTLTGTPGTVVADESSASIPDTTISFQTLGEATILAVAAWAASTAVAVGDRRHRGGIVYQVQVAGVTGVTGPVGEGVDLADGATVKWLSLGPGSAAVDVEAVCVEDGPTEVAARLITQPGTPTLGWDGVINVLDAVPGSYEQSDESLRVTREAALASAADGTPEGIRSNLLLLQSDGGVRSVTVFYNNTDATDGDGLPPHTVEALVYGGDDQQIAEVLWLSVGATVRTVGTTARTVVDSEGVSHTIRFSRPDVVNIYETITVRRDATRFNAVDGVAEIKALLVKFGDAQGTGVDVEAFTEAAQVAPRMVSGVLQETVPGVVGVSSCAVGTAPSPASLSVAITRRQLGDRDTSRITVNLLDPA